MANITFDTDDYYDDCTLNEMIEQETKDYIRTHIYDIMQKKTGIDDFIYTIASQYVEELLHEEISNHKQDIAQKINDVIIDTKDYHIIYSNKFQDVLGEYIEEFRPIIRYKVENACLNKVDADYLICCVCDEFYNILSDMLAKRER